jgi:putative holliday junction resolvase
MNLKKQKNKILAIDYGKKSIGIALSDTSKTFAFARDVICNTSKSIEEIHTLAASENVDTIIIGIPYNTENKTHTSHVKAIDRMKEKFTQYGYHVITHDERYTTQMATAKFQYTTVSAKQTKVHIDSESARILLEEYLHKI